MKFNKVLMEICKFSAIKSTAALSKFLAIPLGVDMKLIEAKKPEDLHLFEDQHEKHVSIFMPITGRVSGGAFFIYSQAAALALCDVLFHKANGNTKSLKDEEISALSEVANMVIGNFLTTFAQSLQIDMLMHRAPVFDCVPFTTALKKRLPIFKEDREEAVLSISFRFQHVNIECFVLIVFEEEKLNEILHNATSTNDI